MHYLHGPAELTKHEVGALPAVTSLRHSDVLSRKAYVGMNAVQRETCRFVRVWMVPAEGIGVLNLIENT